MILLHLRPIPQNPLTPQIRERKTVLVTKYRFCIFAEKIYEMFKMHQ